MWIKKALFALVMALVFSACTKDSTDHSPQKTLSDYVSITFGIKSVGDRQKLASLTTGQVRKTLESLSDDEFSKTFLKEKREFKGLKIKDNRRVQDGKISITYEITFINKTDLSHDVVTNKKSALFVNESGKWLVSEVRNLKTFIEHQNEMTF